MHSKSRPNDGANRMRILLDACAPHYLRHHLAEFDVETAQYAGLDLLPDHALLAAIRGRYDMLITRDRNLMFQNTLTEDDAAVLVLRPTTQSRPSFEALIPPLIEAIRLARLGTFIVIGG